VPFCVSLSVRRRPVQEPDGISGGMEPALNSRSTRPAGGGPRSRP